MKKFKTSLLREKFIITDPDIADKNKAVIALSNRMVVKLTDDDGALNDVFIVRAQNMHSCARMANKIVRGFLENGSIINRAEPFDWEKTWGFVENDYEKKFNPQRWIAIYNKGKSLFKAGEAVHPFLDLIEKCDHANTGEYEESISIAETAFRKTGKNFTIDYDGNVALVIDYDPKEVKCSIILRGPDKTTTFNFSAVHKEKSSPDYIYCMDIAASFLEGMQLGFMVGMNQTKIRFALIDRHSDEEKKTKAAKKRLGQISTEITNLQNSHDVHYRPQRPELMRVITDAEKWAAKTFKPDPKSGLIV